MLISSLQGTNRREKHQQCALTPSPVMSSRRELSALIEQDGHTCCAIHQRVSVLLDYNHLDRAGERQKDNSPLREDGCWAQSAHLLADIMSAQAVYRALSLFCFHQSPFLKQYRRFHQVNKPELYRHRVPCSEISGNVVLLPCKEIFVKKYDWSLIENIVFVCFWWCFSAQTASVYLSFLLRECEWMHKGSPCPCQYTRLTEMFPVLKREGCRFGHVGPAAVGLYMCHLGSRYISLAL